MKIEICETSGKVAITTVIVLGVLALVFILCDRDTTQELAFIKAGYTHTVPPGHHGTEWVKP